MGIILLNRLFCARSVVRRALLFPALIAAAVALVRCGGTDRILAPANFESVDRQFDVWAMSGSSSALPAGYRFISESLVRPQLLGNGSLNFDVAFDITPAGKVLVLPARLIVPAPPAGAQSVGFARQNGVYEQLERATEKGYVTDSSATLAVGETLTIRLTDAGCPYGEPLYAKLAIDEVNVAERRLVMRTLVNRNCGYLSLLPGFPKN